MTVSDLFVIFVYLKVYTTIPDHHVNIEGHCVALLNLDDICVCT